MLTICTWLWGYKYNPSYVDKLAYGLRKHLKQPYRFLCMTNDRVRFTDGVERHAIPDTNLLAYKGCFARLRMFDPDWQSNRGILGPIINLDLDVVITGELDVLFDRADTFVILQGANSVNPCPYNGSVYMFQAGSHSDLWTDFSPKAVSTIPFYKFPDDQGWFHFKIPNAAGWQVGRESGIYAFEKPGWPAGVGLPLQAKIVAFPGGHDPSQCMHFDWVREHWRT